MDRKEYAQDDGVIYEENEDEKDTLENRYTELSLKGLKEYISNCVTSRINPEIMDRINGELGEYHMATDVSNSIMNYIFKHKEDIIEGLKSHEN